MMKHAIYLVCAMLLSLSVAQAQEKKVEPKKPAPAKGVVKKAPVKGEKTAARKRKLSLLEQAEKMEQRLDRVQRGVRYWNTKIVVKMQAWDKEIHQLFPKIRMFQRSHFALRSALRTSKRVDGALIEFLDSFPGALRSYEGQGFVERARHQKAAYKLHKGVMEVMFALMKRYKSASGTKKVPKKVKATKAIKKVVVGKKVLSPKDVNKLKRRLNRMYRVPKSLQLPDSAVNTSLADALAYQMYQHTKSINRLARIWRELEKEVDALPKEKREKLKNYFAGKGAHPFSKSLDKVMGESMGLIFTLLAKANQMDRRMYRHIIKNPQTFGKTPLDLMMLNLARMELTSRTLALGRVMGRTYYKLAGITPPSAKKD